MAVPRGSDIGIQNAVSITLFNKGQAGKIFDDVKKCGARVVLKNNTPECVLISPEEYVALIDEVNDARLLLEASRRMKGYDSKRLVSQSDIDKKYDITEKDLEGYEQVDIE